MRIFLSLVVALGLSLTVAGLLSFIFGLDLKGAIVINSVLLGSLNGDWSSGHFCFLGALLASIGSGVIIVGWLNWKPRAAA